MGRACLNLEARGCGENPGSAGIGCANSLVDAPAFHCTSCYIRVCASSSLVFRQTAFHFVELYSVAWPSLDRLWLQPSLAALVVLLVLGRLNGAELPRTGSSWKPSQCRFVSWVIHLK